MNEGRDDEDKAVVGHFTSPRGTHYFFPRMQSSPELEDEQTLTIDASTQVKGFPTDQQHHWDNQPPPPPDGFGHPSQVSLDDYSCPTPFSASYPSDQQFGYYHRSSWPGTNDYWNFMSQQQQQQQHNFYYHPPPNGAIGRPRPASEQYGPRRKYGTMLSSHENERLFSALTFVRMNPYATLFDIDGTSFETV
jgi:hypothetical protein